MFSTCQQYWIYRLKILFQFFWQKIDHKIATSTTTSAVRWQLALARLEEEENDNFDISLLRFTAAFAYVYLAFVLIAGVVQVSSGHLNDFFPGWVSIMVGLLGIAEVTALLIFLMELKRKVRFVACTLWGVHSVTMFHLVFFWKLQLPSGLHNSCNISSTADGTCQKYSTKYHDLVDAPRCTSLKTMLMRVPACRM